MVKTLCENKKYHPRCVSLGYPNINAIRSKFSDIHCLIENNLNVFIIAERKLRFSKDMQVIPFEIRLKQRNLLLVTIYRPPNQNLDHYLSSIKVVLDHYLQSYEDFIILGDFKEKELNPKIQSFLSQQGCKNIIKKQKCFKSLKRSCIGIIITGRPNLH